MEHRTLRDFTFIAVGRLYLVRCCSFYRRFSLARSDSVLRDLADEVGPFLTYKLARVYR